MIEACFNGALGAFHLDVAFEVPASGVTVLFGPSGCGKTSVLRCLAGLNRLPGRLSVAGEIWQDETRFRLTHRRPVGYVFQEPSLFPHLSVRQNLLFGARRAECHGPEDLDRIVALLGLEPLLGRGTETLSGGEQQRVAIGRALLSRPGLLLMDEPLASLDAKRKAEVIPYIEALQRQAGIPIFYVTHDVTEAAHLGDRMLIMREGRIAETVNAAAASAPAELDWLGDRLGEVGAEELAAEFVLSGTSPTIARLAVESLAARRSART